MTAPAAAATGLAVRLWHLLRFELRCQWRYRIVALVALVTLAWTLLLAVLPVPAARVAAGWILVVDTAVLGTTIVGALVIMEREHGMLAAFAVSPARAGARLAAKVGMLTALVVAGAAPIALAGRPIALEGWLVTLAGVGLVALLTMLLAVAVAADRRHLIGFMVALPLVLLPLLAPALAHLAGLSHPLLYAMPTVGAMDLVMAGYQEPAAGGLAASAAWLVLACAGAAWLARWRLSGTGPAERQRRAAGTARARPTGATVRRRPGAVLAFLRSDLVGIRRDPLLLIIAASPALLGLGLRFGYPPAHAWLAAAYGFDLDPYRPVLLGVAVVLHVPVVFGMIGALMVLDDADSRALTALRTSPLTLPRYLAYRASLMWVATTAGLAVAVPLSGLVPAGALGRSLPAVAAATLLGPLVTMATLAVAGNRVEGVAMLKLLGLPVYAPVAAWWLDGAVGWLPAPLPTWWALRSLWDPPGIPYALGGMVLSAAAIALLAGPALRRLGGGSGAAVEDDLGGGAVGREQVAAGEGRQ